MNTQKKYTFEELKKGKKYLLNFSGLQITGTLKYKNKSGLLFVYEDYFSKVKKCDYFYSFDVITEI
jgi:hypothetical protein